MKSLTRKVSASFEYLRALRYELKAAAEGRSLPGV
jgi:hypothetical protein